MSDGLEAFSDLSEQSAELSAHYSLQQLPQIVEALAPHLPEITFEELVRITNEVTSMVAKNIGIDPAQFSVE